MMYYNAQWIIMFSTMLFYVEINHVLWSLLQDTLLLKSAKEGDLEGVRESLTKQANINIANEVCVILIYL